MQLRHGLFLLGLILLAGCGGTGGGTGGAPRSAPTVAPAVTATLPYPFSYTLPATTPVDGLPSDADCAATIAAHRRTGGDPSAGTVHRDSENHAANNRSPLQGYALRDGTRLAPYRLHDNSFFTQTAAAWGFAPSPDVEQHVTGDFRADSTDEIVQWAACKWGIDVDVVRAQTEQESDFFQGLLGDCAAGQAAYPAITPCQTFGISGLRGGDSSGAAAYAGSWPYGLDSTAFNLDYSLAVRRHCFMGRQSNLSNGYAAGDLWGCVGTWYSGRWHDATADAYAGKVLELYSTRAWKTLEDARQVCNRMNSWRRCLYR